MKRYWMIAMLFSLALTSSTLAQKKKPKPRPAAKATPAAPVKVDTQAEATQVADTLKALTKFIYVYGKISNGLEAAEEQARKTKLPPTTIEKNTQNKNGVIQGIDGLRVQVDKLGTTLQANPRLQVPYINLAGVTQKITEATGLVSNNQFDQAGRSLITAAERLADVLIQVK